MSNEANTCRNYVEPKLNQAGWNTEPYDYYEQYYFTNGKIRPKNQRQPRGKRKFADYLLLKGDFPLLIFSKIQIVMLKQLFFVWMNLTLKQW
jgi:type I restriction enzyme R subunit